MNIFQHYIRIHNLNATETQSDLFIKRRLLASFFSYFNVSFNIDKNNQRNKEWTFLKT